MTESIECPVCLQDTSLYICAIPCGHNLCADCYDILKEKKKSRCPICQIELITNDDLISKWDGNCPNNWQGNPYKQHVEKQHVKIEAMTDQKLECREIKMRQNVKESIKMSEAIQALPIPIMIKRLDGSKRLEKVDKALTVEALKKHLANQIGILKEQIRIIYKGQPLPDAATMESVNIKPGDTLHVILQSRGDIGIWTESQDTLDFTGDYQTWIKQKQVEFPKMSLVSQVLIKEKMIDSKTCQILIDYTKQIQMNQISTNDFQYDMSLKELQSVIGEKSYDLLTRLFGEKEFQIRLRKVLPHPTNIIPFHLDVNTKTLQLVLNDCQGGEVLYVTEQKLISVTRKVGTVTVHEANVLHAVCSVKEERYGLFFLVK